MANWQPPECFSHILSDCSLALYPPESTLSSLAHRCLDDADHLHITINTINRDQYENKDQYEHRDQYQDSESMESESMEFILIVIFILIMIFILIYVHRGRTHYVGNNAKEQCKRTTMAENDGREQRKRTTAENNGKGRWQRITTDGQDRE
jgi:uncharacterized membrane protein